MKYFKEYIKFDINIFAKEIKKYWRKNKIFKNSISSNKGKKKWILYEGPPSSNGLPGIHHLLGCTIKDIFCRYQTLKGKQVYRKAGWDAHGLPIELNVEKFFNIKKEDIGEKISIFDYNKICYNSVIQYIDIWKQISNDIGYWIDQENAYITFNSKYIETIWYILKYLYKNRYVSKEYIVQPYSPIAATGLSNHELNIPGAYKEITDITLIAKFKAIKNKLPISLYLIDGHIYFLGWTTTPWTLPSNTALAIGNSIEYLLVETFNPYLYYKIHIIGAKLLINRIVSDKIKTIPFRIVHSFLGIYIIGVRYEQLLPWLLPYKHPENAFEIISSDIVTINEGTGIVHISPTFGYDDALIAKKNGIPSMLIWDKRKNIEVPLVDLQGKFIKSIPYPFNGKYVKKEYDKENENNVALELAISIYLKNKGKAFKIKRYRHSYPHCWRTGAPILYYPLFSWSINTSSLIEEMIYLNNTIKWSPSYTGKNRFGNWLKKLNDWNISRSRYWGVPLPIWRSKDQTEEKIIGSIKELILEIKKSIETNFMIENPLSSLIESKISNDNQIDLHKPMVDDIIVVSSMGKPMFREEDLVDVWFDSGSMPYAHLHYPFENKEKINSGRFYPADFISEGIDQTRGWFYTLHIISSMLFRSIAYKNVVSNGLVLDKNGQKMSKSKGNTINPFEVIEIYGPDAIRCYIIANSLPWENIKFDLSYIDEVRRKFFGTLYNSYAFFALYANIDRFCYKEESHPIKKRPIIDKWIISELHFLIKNVYYFYDNYDPTHVIRLIANFVITQLSNWYVRLSRRRFWKCNFSHEKISALQTLYDILLVVIKLIAPIAPFFSDRLYKDLIYASKKEIYKSVHLSYFPKIQKNLIDLILQEKMFFTQRIASIVLSIRKKENIKVRQSLKQLKILSLSEDNSKISYLTELIKQEVNVKKIHYISKDEADNLLIKEIRPNFRRLGPRFGKNIYKVLNLLMNFSRVEIKKLEENKYCILKIEGRKQKIGIEEVEIVIKNIKGWSVSFEEDFIIALDIQVDETLRVEGITREFVSKIQQMRKKNNLRVTDKIILYVSASSLIKKAIILNKYFICENTLSFYLYLDSSLKKEKEIKIERQQLSICIRTVKSL